VSVLKNKIVSSDKDQIGIVFFGTVSIIPKVKKVKLAPPKGYRFSAHMAL